MKDKSNNNVYLPRERAYYEPSAEALISHSPEGVDTKLANPVTDDIVANNIASQEFDYTEEPDIDTEIDTNP